MVFVAESLRDAQIFERLRMFEYRLLLKIEIENIVIFKCGTQF